MPSSSPAASPPPRKRNRAFSRVKHAARAVEDEIDVEGTALELPFVRDTAAAAKAVEALSIAVVGACARRAHRRWQADFGHRLAVGSASALGLARARGEGGYTGLRDRLADFGGHALVAGHALRVAACATASASAGLSASSARARAPTAHQDRKNNGNAGGPHRLQAQILSRIEVPHNGKYSWSDMRLQITGIPREGLKAQ